MVQYCGATPSTCNYSAVSAYQLVPYPIARLYIVKNRARVREIRINMYGDYEVPAKALRKLSI